MAKCPIMSYQNSKDYTTNCKTDNCAWWDANKNMCCIKSMALSMTTNNETAQGHYIPPSSYCNTNAVSDTQVHLKQPAIDTSYISF